MKSFKNIFCAVLAAGITLFGACSDLTEEKSDGSSSYIRINATAGRTILPAWSLDTMTDFTLRGVKSAGESETVLAEFAVYTELVSSNIPVSSGLWHTLTLMAKEEDTIFSHTLNDVEIFAGENSLVFNLEPDSELTEGQTGSLNVTFNLGQTNDIKAVKGGLYTRAGEEIEGFCIETIDITQTDGTFYAKYQKSNIAAETYRLKMWFYADEDCALVVATHSELVKITAGNTSAAERNIEEVNEVYTITYEGLDGVEFADGYELNNKTFTRYEAGSVIDLPGKDKLQKTSYLFDGWYSDENYETDITQLELGSSDITVYAKWILGYEISSDEIAKMTFDIPVEYTIRLTGTWNNDLVKSLGTIIKSVGIDCTVKLDMQRTMGITNIEEWAFCGCSCLTSINIPEGVTWIRNHAFDGCTSLESVTIPEGVTDIGESAFSGCSSLTSIEIPDSVTGIGVRAFYYCPGFENVVIGNGVTNLSPFNFKNNKNLVKICIGNGITSIGDETFKGCTSLTSIDIPVSVTSIGGEAFYKCSSLTSIEIPDSVTSIGDGAFSHCSGLESINIPEGITGIGYYTFCVCSSLTSIKIPDSVTRIGSEAFYGCSSLESIEIPDSVTRIGSEAFYDCSSLTSINIPGSVTNIGDCTFRNCSNLTSIGIPDSVTSIGKEAFYNCSGLKSINIPEGITTIGDSTFSGCSSLTSIEMPDSVTTISNNAFSGCSGLENVIIGNGITNLDAFPFSGNKNLKKVVIGNNVTTITKSKFADCSSLTSITFSDTDSIWYYASNADYKNGSVIGPMSATDTAANATLLTGTYSSYYLYNEKYGQ